MASFPREDNRVPVIGGVSSVDGLTPKVIYVDPTTHEVLVKSTGVSPTGKYGISNTEETATYKYFGFEDKDGNWYIMRKTLATNIYLYAAGSSDYATAWTDRATQTYDTFATTFS